MSPRHAASLVLPAVVFAVACSDPGAPVVPKAAVTPSLDQIEAPGQLPIYGLGSVARARPGEPCRAGPSRQFDFWLGTWTISRPDGTPAGTNTITSEVGGCAIEEHFSAPGGQRGRSLSTWDAVEGRWHQSFVGPTGGDFRLSGGLGADGAMVLEGVQLTFSGLIPSRITWTPQTNGQVHQFIENSFDGGQTFSPGFDGLYTMDATAVAPPPAFIPICQIFSLFRELDFAVGSWSVVGGGSGRELGHSEVTKDLNGCLVEERFVGQNGYESTSFFFRDFVLGRWFQTFVDSEGNHFELDGALQADGSVVLTGSHAVSGGATLDLRNTWSAAAGGTLNQTWEASGDGGVTWHPAANLTYRGS